MLDFNKLSNYHLLYQLKGKIHAEFPCSQFEYFKWNAEIILLRF